MNIRHQIIKGLLNKKFFEDNYDLLPKDFGPEEQRILKAIEATHKAYDHDLSVSEVKNLYYSQNPTLKKDLIDNLDNIFSSVESSDEMSSDIASDVMRNLWTQHRGMEIMHLGMLLNDKPEKFDEIIPKLEDILGVCKTNVVPEVDYNHEDMSIQAILEGLDNEDKWKFNIPSLSRQIDGVIRSHFIVGGARPNVGKTSFHATLLAAPGGFAMQGADCHVALNEEAVRRVARRYLTSATGLTLDQIRGNIDYAQHMYSPVQDKLHLFDSTDWSITDLDRYCEERKPDILVIDMLDKVKPTGSYDRLDMVLRAAYVQARDLGKKHDCVVMGFSQLNAEAEGKIRLDQSMLENSRTGKAAEADLIFLIGKSHKSANSLEEDPMRYINVAKNKGEGGHPCIPCTLRGDIGRYEE